MDNDCVHCIPIIDTNSHFKSYLTNPNKDKAFRNKWLIFCLVDATFYVHVWLLSISEANVNMLIKFQFCAIKCLHFVVVGIKPNAMRYFSVIRLKT